MTTEPQSAPEHVESNIPEELAPTPLTPEETTAIEAHLETLGIRNFDDPGGPQRFLAYVTDLLGDTRCAEVNTRRNQRGAENSARYADDIAFYELFSDQDTARALQSTRYDYFRQTGPRVVRYLPETGRYIDLGCNTGALTTYYAQHRPGIQFLGLDRVPAPLKVARKEAGALGLTNVKFDVADALRVIPGRNLDGIISTTAFWRKVEFHPRDLQRFESATPQQRVQFLQALPAMRFNATVMQQIQKSLRPGGQFILMERLADKLNAEALRFLQRAAGFTEDAFESVIARDEGRELAFGMLVLRRSEVPVDEPPADDDTAATA